MTHLTVYPDTDPATVLTDTRDGDEIAGEKADARRWVSDG